MPKFSRSSRMGSGTGGSWGSQSICFTLSYRLQGSCSVLQNFLTEISFYAHVRAVAEHEEKLRAWAGRAVTGHWHLLCLAPAQRWE